MFGTNMNYSPMTPLSLGDNSAYRLRAAMDCFRAAQFRGSLRRTLALLTGRSPKLKKLSTVVGGRPVTGRHAAGLQAVSIDQICGSEGRAIDFDRFFNPLSAHSRQRWVSVLLARWMDVPLEAVQLIQIGESYFVRDGHHRVSVARALGETCIEAEVTVWTVPGAQVETPVRSRASGRTRPALKSEG